MGKLVVEDGFEVQEFEIPDGDPIADACEKSGIPFACTEGVCGTCVVEIVEGGENLSDFNQAEKDFLGDSENERLACQCKLKGGCVKITF